MLNMLSQEEIDALLDVNDDDFLTSEIEVTPYDFNKPNIISKDQLRSFRTIHDNIARLLSFQISSITHTTVKIQLNLVDQMRYGDFLTDLSSCTSANLFFIKPLEKNGVIDINSSIVFSILDSLLGGKGKPFDIKREFSDIELNLFEMILGVIINTLKEAWSPIIDIFAIIDSKESKPNIMQNIAENDIIITASMEVVIGQNSGVINICYPLAVLETILPKLASKNVNNNKVNIKKNKNVHLQRLLGEVKIEIEAIIGNVELTLKDVLELKSGDIIKLNKPADDIITLSIDKKDRFRGKIGLKKSKKSMQITESIGKKKSAIIKESVFDKKEKNKREISDE
ncbi:flagellar motor switch protein FliM [Sulfurimonas sp. CVO]|uniref:flagellar motor switch protein FliM n=1 Tax=Sulfurimonas sp. CVO TaxID=2283483 RepID=UPI00132EE468|nr:flagellar motor switch protein FliM [Sulfurimonas sp. CVO]QHG91495.1 flagellar motor switch protein FliM [Sulfurimonas sp. CVO]